MNPLTKSVSTEPNPGARISEADRAFCQAHQRAYDTARKSLQEFESFWKGLQLQEQEALAPYADDDIPPESYLVLYGAIQFTWKDVRRLRRSLHEIFIYNLVTYFNMAYHLSIRTCTMEENLLPNSPSPKNSAYDPEETEEDAVLESLSLHYTDILEQLFLQTGGRDLAEAAVIELKGKCRLAAWNSDNGSAEFKLKKYILQLRCGCNYQDYYPVFPTWELYQETLDILTGLAYFEAGSFSGFPDCLNQAIQHKGFYQSDFTFTDCHKVHSIKLYKNHRTDIIFYTEEHAVKFVEEYLGTLPPC